MGQQITDVSCPYCGEPGQVLVEQGLEERDGAGAQEFVQDCEVCCRPWDVTVKHHPHGGAAVSVARYDE